jgi:hypothetical protein
MINKSSAVECVVSTRPSGAAWNLLRALHVGAVLHPGPRDRPTQYSGAGVDD